MTEASRPRTLDPANLAPLEAWLAGEITAKKVSVGEAELLAGGAVGENWRLAVTVAGGPRAGAHQWVLRTDAAARLPLSLDRAHEFACLKAAEAAGVTVAAPIACSPDKSVIGAPFMVQGFVTGSAHGRRLVRDPALKTFGPALTERLGTELARIHAITPETAGLAFLDRPKEWPAKVQVQQIRALLDEASEPRPALEYVLVRLAQQARPADRVVLCHGDFRTGNYMVETGRLTAILDWEFAHFGDPMEDIGWFMARCWRFGGDGDAGGIASREDFLKGYEAVAGTKVDRGRIAYWEIMAAARWAAIAALQGERHLSGREPSIELMLTGVMVPEMELDCLLGLEQLGRDG